MDSLYCDHNATSPIRAEVASLLAERFAQAPLSVGNPSSVHRAGRAARVRLEKARQGIARAMGCDPKEVCITASGSEANALALKGVWGKHASPGRRKLVTSSIEHPSILSALPALRAQGAEVVVVPPDSQGRIDLARLREALTEEVRLCSLMWANNETGVLQPVAQAAEWCKAKGIVFHTDAVQAVGKVPVSFSESGADLLSFSAHKFGGPAGIGALLIRRGVDLEPLVAGHQEWGRRGGTQNVPYIEALALALSLAVEELRSSGPWMRRLRDKFEAELVRRIPQVSINGAGIDRLPNTSNVEIASADGEALLIALDLEGICISSGAACASGSLSPSHVLTAMGKTASQAHGTLRFSLGPRSTDAEVDRVLEALERHVPAARQVALTG